MYKFSNYIIPWNGISFFKCVFVFCFNVLRKFSFDENERVRIYVCTVFNLLLDNVILLSSVLNNYSVLLRPALIIWFESLNRWNLSKT